MGVKREGYEPDIDLGCLGDGSSEAAAAPPMDPVVIYPEDDHGVQVSAVLVQHAPVFPAFGFRFDTPQGSVVFSGDTGPCDNVVRLAAGADVLVHEVIDVDALTQRITRLPNYEAVRNHLASSHTAPEQVGEIAARAGVRHARALAPRAGRRRDQRAGVGGPRAAPLRRRGRLRRRPRRVRPRLRAAEPSPAARPSPPKPAPLRHPAPPWQ